MQKKFGKTGPGSSMVFGGGKRKIDEERVTRNSPDKFQDFPRFSANHLERPPNIEWNVRDRTNTKVAARLLC